MTMKSFHRLLVFLILLLVQVQILSHLHIGGFGSPALYLYYILALDAETSRNNLMIQAFVAGLCVDIFAVTPGMNAAAATLMAFMRPTLLRMQTVRDMADDYEPSVRSMGVAPYVRYITGAVLVFEVTLCLLDSFTLFRPATMMLHIVADTLVTVLCVLCVDAMRRRRA